MIKLNQLRSLNNMCGDNRESDQSIAKWFRKSRQVIFAGHPSLRFGEIVHFMELYRSCEQSAIVFVEPDFSDSDQVSRLLAPFQPLKMKVFKCPLDTSLTVQQANILLKRRLRPLQVLTSIDDSELDAVRLFKHESTSITIPEIIRSPIYLELCPSLAQEIVLNRMFDQWMIGPFDAKRSTHIRGRFNPAVQCGGVMPFIAKPFQLQTYKRQYACVPVNIALTAEVVKSMLSLNCHIDNNTLKTESGDTIVCDAVSDSLMIVCDDANRRNELKKILKTLYKPLFV